MYQMIQQRLTLTFITPLFADYIILRFSLWFNVIRFLWFNLKNLLFKRIDYYLIFSNKFHAGGLCYVFVANNTFINIFVFSFC